MRWEDQKRSRNIEDRRGQRVQRGGMRRGGGMIPLRGKTGIVVLLVVMIAGYYGIDLSPLLLGESSAPQVTQVEHRATPEEQRMAEFTAVALAKTEDLWQQKFRDNRLQYREPTLVLYTGATSTACGFGQAAMGPFYCPADEKVYIDLSFYHDMKQKLGGGGDFAQGYVIAHEVGHHVQHLLGITTKVRQMQQRVSQKEANALSVKMELQADCFAGIWGKTIQDQGLLEIGDLEKAMNTAAAIGDDRLQKQARGTVVPDSFTHGTSAQRQAWFKRGFDYGTFEACDTFSAK